MGAQPRVMRQSTRRWTRLGVVGAAALLIGQAAAEPMNPATAEAMTRGWLAESRARLSGKMPSRIKSVESYGHFHVVHLHPAGFVVSAADDELEPVIAFSNKGIFQPNQIGRAHV